MRIASSMLGALACLFTSSLAHAHISASASGAYTGATVEASFGVGHGCEGLDTYSVKIKIPSSVTSVRVVENGSFANVSIEKDPSGNVVAVTFTKAQAAVRAADEAYYKLVLRAKLPAAAFTTVYFPTTQTCKSQDGATTKTTEWIAEAGDTSGAEPAPSLFVLPTRSPGWNSYTTGAGVTLKELATIFKDALIVWAGDAAYSANPSTAAQIAAEEGVALLEAIEPGTAFWVKY